MIKLVLMPFCDVERPSLGLGLLKAALAKEGIRADVIYANLRFAKLVGIHASSLPLRIWANSLLGEWVFARAAFPGFSPPEDRYLQECIVPFARFNGSGDGIALAHGVQRELKRLRAAAPCFVNKLARDLLVSRPKIIGCSSTFAQQVASLAILRRIRELDPEVITLIGGANVEDSMGTAVIRTFPWVDATCSGQADETLASFCRAVAQRGRAALQGPLPEGFVTRHVLDTTTDRQGISGISKGAVSDLDALPIPDYDDYFSTLGQLTDSDRRLFRVVLPMETSRGCWWNGCTFCGLNQGIKTHRAKKPERVRRELEILTARYGVNQFAMADNVMPTSYVTSLFPSLENQRAPYRIFYEVRPSLRREHARQLYAAGVRHIQAGIEALHDRLLVLMRKGTSVLENVALLKHAREFGIVVGWHLLTGIPGDNEKYYAETAQWLPVLSHFQPPTSLHGVTLQRFSAYLNNPLRHGLNPVPYNSYEFVYPPGTMTCELAYCYRDASWPEFFPEMNRETNGLKRLFEAVDHWRNAFWRSPPPWLSMKVVDTETVALVDTRPCALSREITLCGLSARIFRLAQEPVHLSRVSAELAAQGVHASLENLTSSVQELVAARLVLFRASRLLSLAVSASDPSPLPPLHDNGAEASFHGYLADLQRQLKF